MVVGENANRQHAPGGGSAEIKALYEITPLMGLHMVLGGNTEIVYQPGYFNKDIGNIWAADKDNQSGQADSLATASAEAQKNTEEQKRYQQEMNEKYLQEALESAKDADAVIYVGGLTHDYDTEGQDRINMKLPYGQDRLISELLKVRPDRVVVLTAGSPIDMSAWIHAADTLVFSWYAGMEGGIALAEMLFGDVNPSGHLPETFPISEKNCPAVILGEFPGGDRVHYGEDIYVGYRYYDTFDIETAFPFGYGLSYTDFVMTGIRAEVLEDTTDNKCVKVDFDISNIGSRAGAALAQVYVADKYPRVQKPAKELKAFEKIYLEPGETREITMILEGDAFTYYDETSHGFKADAGSYMLLLAKNADEVVDITEIEFNCTSYRIS